MPIKETIKNIPSNPILLGAISITVGLSLGLLSAYIYEQNTGQNNDCTSNFKFINPDTDCEGSVTRAEALTSLQNKLSTEIDYLKNTKDISYIGVSVRDLGTKRLAEVDANHVFYLASLLKVPLAMAYLKLSEVDKNILDDTSVYDGNPNLYKGQNIKPEEMLKVGAKYSVRDLLNRALIYSDNTAAEILARRLPNGFLDKISYDLGIRFEKANGVTEDLITPKIYASVFRSLYNSSYLQPEQPNSILETLTHTTYKDGVVSAIPSNVVVSHKFAERSVYDPNTGDVLRRQLHECGVVYLEKPLSPYIFCIMTEGKNFDDLSGSISKISSIIYKSMTD